VKRTATRGSIGFIIKLLLQRLVGEMNTKKGYNKKNWRPASKVCW